MIYRCWTPEYGHTEEDARRIEAPTPEEAAIRYVDRRNAEACEGGVTTTVRVKHAITGDLAEFDVEREIVANYFVTARRDVRIEPEALGA